MSYRPGSTADLRHRWGKVAAHLDAAGGVLGGHDGLATHLDGETADYRAMVAVHVMHATALLADLAHVEASSITGDDAGASVAGP